MSEQVESDAVRQVREWLEGDGSPHMKELRHRTAGIEYCDDPSCACQHPFEL